MDRSKLRELGFITPIANLPSIRARGILARNVVHGLRLRPRDISMAVIQSRRAGRPVPDVGRQKPLELRDYANVYVCPRNPVGVPRRCGTRAPVVVRLAAIEATQSGCALKAHQAARINRRDMASLRGGAGDLFRRQAWSLRSTVADNTEGDDAIPGPRRARQRR